MAKMISNDIAREPMKAILLRVPLSLRIRLGKVCRFKGGVPVQRYVREIVEREIEREERIRAKKARIS